MNQKQIEALAKKNAAKANKVQAQRQKSFDATLDATRSPSEDETGESVRMFKEMKKREF